MCGSACARMLLGSCGGSSPSRMFVPTRGSSATAVVSIGAAGITSSSCRSRSINPPEDTRFNGIFRIASGSCRRSGPNNSSSVTSPSWAWMGIALKTAMQNSAPAVWRRIDFKLGGKRSNRIASEPLHTDRVEKWRK